MESGGTRRAARGASGSGCSWRRCCDGGYDTSGPERIGCRRCGGGRGRDRHDGQREAPDAYGGREVDPVVLEPSLVEPLDFVLDAIVRPPAPVDDLARVPVKSRKVCVRVAELEDGPVGQRFLEDLSRSDKRSRWQRDGWYGRVGDGDWPRGEEFGGQVYGLEKARLVDDKGASDGDVTRAGPDVLLLGVLGRRADVEAWQGVLVELVVTTHGVKTDVVPDGRAVDVEVIAARLGAEEALERRGHLLGRARDVGLDEIREEDGVAERRVPVRFAEVGDGEHGAGRRNEVPRVLDGAHLMRVVGDGLFVKDALRLKEGVPAVRPVLRGAVGADDVDREVGTEKAHRSHEEVDAALNVLLRVGLEPEDPSHAGRLADDAEDVAVHELSRGPRDGAEDVEQHAIEGAKRASCRRRQVSGGSSTWSDRCLSGCRVALLEERVADVAVLGLVRLDDFGSESRHVGDHERVTQRGEEPTRRDVPEDAVPQTKEVDRGKRYMSLADTCGAQEGGWIDRGGGANRCEVVDDGVCASDTEVKHAKAIGGEPELEDASIVELNILALRGRIDEC